MYLRIKLIPFVILLLFLSCKVDREQVRFYPAKQSFTNTEQLKICSVKNYKEVITLAETIRSKKRIPEIIIKDENIRKRIIPFTYGNGLTKERNILKITTDSVLIDNGYTITNLKQLLKRHYLNKGNIPYYSDSPQKAIIEINFNKNENCKDIKGLLIKLTRTFDEVNREVKDSLKLNVFFNLFKYIPPPMNPPPPSKL